MDPSTDCIYSCATDFKVRVWDNRLGELSIGGFRSVMNDVDYFGDRVCR